MTRALEELSLADMVADALAQRGVRAVVLEKDSGLSVSTRDAPPVWVDAAADLQQWSMLPTNIRQRKANLLAMRVVHIQRGGDDTDPSKSASTFVVPPWLRPIVEKAKELASSARVKIIGAVVLAIGTLVAILALTRKEPLPPPPPDPNSETAAQRTARLGRACDAARAMMWRGGTWAAMPLEGWTVELWLSRNGGDPISTHAALSKVVHAGKVHWGNKSVFAQITDGNAEVVAGSAVPPRNEATIVFGDGYARPFFDIDRRHEFISIAQQLVNDTNADWGALHAHCAHITARDVGAWCFVREAGKAATSLRYTMGKPVGSKGTEFTPLGKDFGTLSTLAARLDEPALFGLVYQDGARTSNREGIFVTFPFTNPVNAAQASKRLATEIGL